MPTPIPDLWPEHIAQTTEVSPLSILNEQAALLREKTEGYVEGEVDTIAIPEMSPINRGDSLGYLSVIGELHEIPKAVAVKEPKLIHSFYVKVPALDNYRFLLLTVLHGAKPYPLALSYSIANESVRATSEDELLHWLREFLSRRETVGLVQSLWEQARSVRNSGES